MTPEERLDKLKKDLFISKKKEKIKKIEDSLAEEATWSDWEEGQKLSQDLADLKRDIDEIELLELLLSEGETKEFESAIKKLEMKTFLSGKHDKGPAILSIHAGQGGIEAMDWVDMLSRMYERFAESRGWKISLLHRLPGEVAGSKVATFEIAGLYSYGFLKNESGVHRLVRQSPFNADSLRQTSFALVEIIPVLSDDIEIEVKDEDVEFEAFRSSGHGGQNVNKVSTAVRIKHLPTKIVVECQESRTQGKNREKAMKILKSKLYALEQQKIAKEKAKLKGDYKTPGWGNQIRNYVLHPYKLVKDLRTGVESTSPDDVLDGALTPFVEEEIKLSY